MRTIRDVLDYICTQVNQGMELDNAIENAIDNIEYLEDFRFMFSLYYQLLQTFGSEGLHTSEEIKIIEALHSHLNHLNMR